MTRGWQTQELGDLATVGAGNSAPQDEALFADGAVPFFRTSDVGRIRFGDIITAADLLNERGARGLRRLPAGTILLPKSGASTFLNHRVMMRVDGCVASHLATITAKPEAAEPRFLLYFLATVQAQDMVQDHAYPSLNLPLISAIKVPTPSLPEQRRIVAILDEAFEGIATAKAKAEKNLRNTRELFAGHLQTVFSQRGHGWASKTVQQWVDSGVLAKPQDGNHGEIHPTKADYVESGVPFIMAADMIDGGVDTEGCRFIARAQASALRIGFAKTGDVLLSHKGTIGRVAILDTTDEYVILTPQVTYYRPLDGSRLFNGFLYYCLLSPEFQAAMNRIAGAGSTRAYIGITRQLDLKLTLPPIDVQRETAAGLRRIDEASNRLAGVYEAKLVALDELKKALLQQAFTGALTERSTDKQLAEIA